MAKYKKVTKWERFKGWCDDHAEEIVVGGILVLSAVGGAIIGHELGKQKGYRKGISDLASQVPDMIDYCGKAGTLAHCNAIYDLAEKSGHEEYLNALDNIDDYQAGAKAFHNFYDDEGVKSLLKQMDDTKNGNW